MAPDKEVDASKASVKKKATKRKSGKTTKRKKKFLEPDSPIGIGGGGGTLMMIKRGRPLVGNANVNFERNTPPKYEKDTKNKRRFYLPNSSLKGIEVWDNDQWIPVPGLPANPVIEVECAGTGHSNVTITITSPPLAIEFPKSGDFAEFQTYFHCVYLGINSISMGNWYHEFSTGVCLIVLHSN